MAPDLIADADSGARISDRGADTWRFHSAPGGKVQAVYSGADRGSACADHRQPYVDVFRYSPTCSGFEQRPGILPSCQPICNVFVML